MSVIDQLNKLFSKKSKSSEPVMEVSLQDLSVEPSIEPDRAMEFSESVNIGMEATTAATESEMLRLPLLGQRTTAQHQRLLAVTLGVGLVLLAGVTLYALRQADKVAQQATATGQSLTQSQRLAKSVSQALVGVAQAFPDVKESSEVQRVKTRRGGTQGQHTQA